MIVSCPCPFRVGEIVDGIFVRVSEERTPPQRTLILRERTRADWEDWLRSEGVRDSVVATIEPAGPYFYEVSVD